MIFDKILKTLGVLVVLVITIMLSSNYINTWTIANPQTTTIVDEVVFPHDEIVKVNIDIEEDQYALLNENAEMESYVTADITYNGLTFSDIAIRAKGNSSLKSVASSDSDRYSFKIDFNYYVGDQSFYGITKLNLNNIFGDASYMREYIAYEALESLDSVASRTTYVELYINDVYFGLYLAVEDVNDDFLYDNYESNDGELYKPEMSGGSDLDYIDDSSDSYNGIEPDDGSESDNEDIIDFMQAIESGENLEEIFNVDGFLKYLAVSTFTVNMDSYQGGMYHNYYLYNDDGYFEWIPWDLNMAFNGFPAMTDEEAINLLIDEPVIGEMSGYPLIETILSDENNMEIYHGYLEELMSNYFGNDNFSNRVDDIYGMIDSYVEEDPTSFYTYDEFVSKVYESNESTMSILDFVSERTDSVMDQLSGAIASTNDGMGNTSSRGFSVGNNFGRVGGQGFATNGGPAVNDGTDNQIDNQANEMSLDSPPLDGPQLGGDMQTVILEALKKMDNLPSDIEEYISNDTLPPREIMDSFIAENNIDIMALAMESNPDMAQSNDDLSVNLGENQNLKQGVNQGLKQGMEPGVNLNNGNNQVIIETTSNNYSVAGYIGLSSILLITLLITFIISRKK